jgi:hypothetical protein
MKQRASITTYPFQRSVVTPLEIGFAIDFQGAIEKGTLGSMSREIRAMMASLGENCGHADLASRLAPQTLDDFE